MTNTSASSRPDPAARRRLRSWPGAGAWHRGWPTARGARVTSVAPGHGGPAHEAPDGVDHHHRPVQRVDAQRGVGLGPDRVVDLADDVLDAERLGRQLGGQDVAVVAVGERQEPVGAFGAGTTQDALVGAVAAQGLAREARGQAPEGLGASRRGW